MKSLKLTVAALVASAAFAGVAVARDQVQIAGSSTVLPYAKIVAETFGETFPDFKTPIVESGGSSGGLKEFCKGVGPETIDIANSSRPIKDSEIEACKAAGVTEIQEVKIGYDGIVFATDAGNADLKLEPKDLYLALAAEVVVDGKLVANPYKKWSEVNAALPDAGKSPPTSRAKSTARAKSSKRSSSSTAARTRGAQDVIKAAIADAKEQLPSA
jgi:phosphate transport system substrate-binding protein